MATDKLLKFYKGGSTPSAATVGSVWFDTTNRLINVKVSDSGDKQWESYSGLQNASWIESSKTLRLVKANGENLDINLSDVASASALTLVDSRLGVVETWKATADGDITTLKTNVGNLQTEAGKNTAKLADIAEGETVKAKIDAAVLVEENRAKGVESGFETRIGSLETTVNTDHEGRIDALEALFSGSEGESVQDLIDDAIETYNTDVVTPGLASKADKETYEAYVKSNDEALAAVKKTAEDEVARAVAEDAALNEKIGVPAGVEGVDAYSKNYTVGQDVKAAKDAAAAAQKTIDDFLTGEGIDPAKVETLKEIVEYIETHGGQYGDVVDNLNTLNTDVAALQGKVDVEKVSTAIATAKGEAVSSANGYADGLISAEVERAEAAYEKIGVAKGLVDGLANGAVAANTAALALVDGKIATAKGEAIADADGKLASAKTELQGYADGKASAAETAAKGYADEKVTALANGAVAANTSAISALDTKITEGLSWVTFDA